MISESIRTLVAAAVSKLRDEQGWDLPEIPAFDVSRTKDEQFGDWAVNVAMLLAKPLGKNPMEIAESIKDELLKQIQDDKMPFEKIEVASPGYINFFLSPAYLTDILGEVLEKGERFGDSEIGKGKKINNEFISANPVGPLHLGNGRGGFYGDALARILRKTGHEVVNEYYVNDAGEQILVLGHSVLKDEQAIYPGEYIDDLHERFGKQGGDVREVGERSAAYLLENDIKKTVPEEMRIAFDSWISEKKDIVETGLVDRAIASFKEKGIAYESEGAFWLRTTDYGDDKDRVLVKQDGSRTYFASDCGYILHKMERGFDTLIIILGADHHGYTARFRAAAQALGFTGEIKFFVVQLVRLMKDGKEIRMSKRAGNVVSIDELVRTVGHDAARFFFLMYSPDTHMNFDLGLAQEHSEKNPVYYVEYAYARLASILRKAQEAGLSPDHASLPLLVHPKEQTLIKELAFFPELLRGAAEQYAPHKLPTYAMRLADRLHSFYAECRVIDQENVELSRARLALVSGVKVVLGETLRVLGIDAPEKM